MKKLVSIIVCCHNEKLHIEKCLKSLLKQDYGMKFIEIMVVDGMSTDGTREIVQNIANTFPTIRMIDNPHKFTPFGLNIGIREAKGEFIARPDAHTESPENYISECVKYLEADKTIACVGGITKQLMTEFEPNETELVKKHLRKGDVFVDVGAYVGYYTLLASELVGEEGSVYAFEPTPESYKELKKAIEGKENIKAYPYAVASKTGKTTLHYYRSNDTNRIIDVAPYLNVPQRTSEVLTIDLDSFYRGKIDFIKADVEGSEYLVFKGAERHLKENHDIKLMFELPDFKVVELFNFLKELRFKSYLIKEQLEEFDIKDLETEKGELYDNIQCFKILEKVTNIFCKR